MHRENPRQPFGRIFIHFVCWLPKFLSITQAVMIIVAIHKRKAILTAAFTSISSKLASSLIYSFRASFSESPGAIGQHSYGQYKGAYSGLPDSLNNAEDIHFYYARLSQYKLSYYPQVLKCCSSQPNSLCEGISLRVGISFHGLAFLYPCFRHFSSAGSSTILRQARNPALLAEELEIALENRRIEDVWKAYQHYKQQEGFPRKSLLNQLICVLAYSGGLEWLDKAYALVLLVIEEKKWDLLDHDSLTLLCLNLARAGMPVPASTILRTMVEMHKYPPVNMWSAVIAHMAKAESGAYLAAEIVIEMCYFFKNGKVDPRKKSNNPLFAMKPDTTAFNIALNASLAFGSTRKAEQLLELMPRIGVKADATSFFLMAQIYEKNGRRDELKKLKRHIDEAPGMLDHQYQQFYSSLLTSHLNFGDLDAASELVLDMLKRAKAAQSSLTAAKSVLEAIGRDMQSSVIRAQNAAEAEDDNSPQKSAACIVSEKLPKRSAARMVSETEHMYSVILAEAKELQRQSLVRVKSDEQLVIFENSILIPNEKIYAKLVKGYLEADRIYDLAQFLIKVQLQEVPLSAENSTSAQVINACIALGCLDQAHDILDEMNAAEVPVGVGVYSSLLIAYCKAKRPMEAVALLKDVRKAGLQLNANCYDSLIESQVSHKDLHGALDLFKEMRETKVSSLSSSHKSLMNGFTKHGKPNLMACLLEVVKEDRRVNVGVHDWNSVIHFFSKANLMHDAQKSLKKMKDLGYQPNAQTFHSMINGYSTAGGKYKEITMLWADMKMMSSKPPDGGIKPLKFDQELLDSLLYNFVRGGFFERALEVIGLMEQQKMFIDKFKYRQVFLKFHRSLYKNKKTPKAQTEAQFKRREQVMAYKKWAGLD